MARTRKHTAFIALGSNLGSRQKNITAALAALEATREVEIAGVSALYETEPVGGPDGQGKFINAVARLRTTLSAERLMALCLRIEMSLGRVRKDRWGPRVIDLDILLFDDAIQSTSTLTIPHPLMHERRFVLEPLAEIAPEVVHPALLKTAREMLETLSAGDDNLRSAD